MALSNEGRTGQILRESPPGTATSHGVVPGLVGPGQLRVRCEKKEAEERARPHHRHEWRYGNARVFSAETHEVFFSDMHEVRRKDTSASSAENHESAKHS